MKGFSEAALVLVGHGSTVNAESSRPTYQHAGEIRRRKIFGQVRECFWKEEPSIVAVMRGVLAREVYVVPLFISEGYFTEQVIPRELGLCDGTGADFARVQVKDGRTIRYCGPVGTHASMTAVLLERAREIVRQFPFPREPQPSEISLFIAGHGTGNNENSRRSIESQAERIRQMSLYAEVNAVFMQEEPRIADCYEQAATRNIVMVPFFISDGLHSNEDIPVMLGEPASAVRARLEAGQPVWRNPAERKKKRVWYARSIGSEARMADVILERAREMAEKNL